MQTRGLFRSLGVGLVMSVLLAGAVGCGGTLDPEPVGNVDMAKSSGVGDMATAAASGSDGGLLPLFTACTADSQCASDKCTMQSYDRSPTPICTYACDPTTDTNPLCPMGCNPKFFCKMPNN
jgi:hypothetical protein